MEILLKIIHVIAAVFLILVVLLQSGRGGGVGAALGGASAQVFGGRGAGNFLTRLTTGAAVVFFCTSMTLSMMSSRHRSVMVGNIPQSAAQDGNNTDAQDGNGTGAAGQQALPSSDSVKTGTAADANGTPANNPDKPAATPPGVPSGK